MNGFQASLWICNSQATTKMVLFGDGSKNVTCRHAIKTGFQLEVNGFIRRVVYFWWCIGARDHGSQNKAHTKLVKKTRIF